MKKRLLALLVVCAMLISLLPTPALAYDGGDASVCASTEEAEPEAVAEESADTDADEAEESEADEADESATVVAEEVAAEEAEESAAEEAEEVAAEDADESAAEEAEEVTAEEADESSADEPGESAADESAALETQSTSPFENITVEVDNITRFSFDRFECEDDPDTDEDNWQQLDCWPGEDNLRIVYNDGINEVVYRLHSDSQEEEQGARYFNTADELAHAISNDFSLEGVNVGWTSDETSDHLWGLGTHTARFYVGIGDPNNENNQSMAYTDYEVQVIAVSNIAVGNFSRSVYEQRFHAEDEDDHPNEGKVNCWPNAFTVTIDEGNGNTSDFSLDEDGRFDEDFLSSLRDVYPGLREEWQWDWRSDEDAAHPAEAGDEIQARFFLYGYYDEENGTGVYASYTVTLEDNSPFAEGSSVEDFSIYETNKALMNEDEDDDHDQPWQWERLNCDPRDENCVTVKLKNDEGAPISVTGNRWEVEQKLRDDYDLNLDLWWSSEEEPGDNWTAQSHPTITAKLTAHLWDGNFDVDLCTYTVTVKAAPFTVTDVEVWDNNVWRRDGDRQDGEDGEEDWYWYPSHPKGLELTVACGGEEKTFEGDQWEVERKVNRFLEEHDCLARFPIDDFEVDLQDKEHWEIGKSYTNTLMVNGQFYDYQVHVWNHPIEKISINPITRLISDRSSVDWEAGTSWDRVDCWPDEITVTTLDSFTDEQGEPYTFTGRVEDVQDRLRETLGFDSEICWASDEGPDPDNTWTAGAHSAFLFLRDYEDLDEQGQFLWSWSYDVTVVDSPVKAVAVDDRKVFETQWREEDYWEDDEQFWWHRLDCWPENIRVTLSDNTVLEGDPGELRDQLREQYQQQYPNLRLDCNWDSEQDNENSRWFHKDVTAGSSIQARFSFFGVESEPYKVTVKQNPIRSLTVAPISRFDTDRNEMDWYDGENMNWSRIDCWPDEITVVTSKGSYTNDPDRVKDWLRDNFGYDNLNEWDGTRPYWESEESPNLQWEASQTPYSARFFFGGAQADYAVTVTHAPQVQEIQVQNENNLLCRFEDDRQERWGRYAEDDEEDFEYRAVNAEPEWMKVKVDGKSYEGRPDEIREQMEADWPGVRIMLDWDSDEKPVSREHGCRGNWTTGTYKNEAWVTVLGVEQRYTVRVIDPDAVIDDVQVSNITRLVTDRTEHWSDELKTDWMRVNCYPGDVTVTLDGHDSYTTGDFNNLRAYIEETLQEDYPGICAWVNWDSDEEPFFVAEDEPYTGNWTAGPTHRAWLDVCGFGCDYNVELIESSITITDVAPVARFVSDRVRRDDWDEVNERNVTWFAVDAYPGEVTVQVNGQPVTGRLDRRIEDPESLLNKLMAILDPTGEKNLNLDVDWGTREGRDGEGHLNGSYWEAGEYQSAAWVSIGGCAPYRYDVTVEENPVVKVEVPAQTVEDTQDNRFPHWGNLLNCEPKTGPIKLWLEGREEPVVGEWSWGEDGAPGDDNIQIELEEALREMGYKANVWVDWDTEEQPENLWHHGSHTATLVVCGLREHGDTLFSYPVNVTDPSHSMTFFDAVDAACTTAGRVAHWVCDTCGKIFAADKVTELKQEDTVIQAKGHSLRRVAAKAATETAAGNIEYWTCGECGKYFRNSAGTQEITQAQTVVPARGHSLRHVAAKAAAVGVSGNIEYWTCTGCGKYFRDSTGTQEITQAQTVLPALVEQRVTLTAADVSVAASGLVYDGKAKTPAVTVTSRGKTLTQNQDYTLTYANNVNAGTATVSVTGIGKYMGVAVKGFAIAKAKPTITANDLVKTASKTVKYKLSAKAPGKLSFKSNNKKAVSVDAKGNIKLAKAQTMYTAKITITSAATANYLKGTKTVVVMIGPAVNKLSSVKPGKAKKTIDAVWTKGKKGVSAYQIQYALDKGFTKGTNIVKVNGLAKTKTTLKGLQSGKKYFIRVRTVQGKFYSPWTGARNGKAK